MGGGVSPKIVYNNFANNSNYNINLSNGASGVLNDVNATYNWWGTTNTADINQSIYDSYDDFNLGTVTFTPFLNETNTFAPEIPPNIIPDLPTNLLTILIIVSLTATTLIIRERLLKDKTISHTNT